ncbi:hypothetical protein [Luteolibacter marinus]|uniref:hypothetical protein n=1 Tax=Luteolibacter marinus TaxID=2776705 RepID=UPI0018673970|nr:hypothetical protein [Luteolibacter marinus]
MSKRVIIIGVLMCLAGFAFGFLLAGSLLGGAGGQLPGRLLAGFLAAGFALLPAGIGILLGYRFARKLAILPIGAGYLASALLLAAPLIPAIQVSGPVQGYLACVAVALFVLGLLLLLHWTLYTAPFEDHLS